MTDGARIYQLMVLTAIADGHLDTAEQSTAARLLHETPELQGIEGRPALAKAARELMDRTGLAAAVEEIAAPIQDPAARRLAIVCCGAMLKADGRFALEEVAVMSQLRRTFGLSIEEWERMIS
jgi:tellurite resistance protein